MTQLHTRYRKHSRMRLKPPTLRFSSRNAARVSFVSSLFVFSLLVPLVVADEHYTDLLSPGSPLTTTARGEQISPSDLSSPMLFIRHLRQQDSVDGSVAEVTRLQRQIKFKSSYTELPEALKKLQQRKGKSLSGEEQPLKVIEDEMNAPDSAALKDLPPSSEVYFKPHMNYLRKNALIKHFGKVRSQGADRKRGRFVRKKMVGRKLIQNVIPNPKKVDTNKGKSVNSLEKHTNKIDESIRRGSRRFLFPTRKSSNNISHSGNSGGPNPVDTFRNPHFVDTSSKESSSYSRVPEESFLNFQPKEQRKGSSLTPTPKKVTPEKSQEVTKNIAKSTAFNSFIPAKNRQSSSNTLKSRVKSKPIAAHIEDFTERSSLSKWGHFLGHSNKQVSRKSSEKVVAAPQRNKKVKVFKKRMKRPKLEKKGKSLHHSGLTQSMEKRVRQETGYPNLLSIPRTNFDCGEYSAGEYFADKETSCQVFHVCFGGRQASFICPVGTAFSQELLVCDWWHKVKC